MRTKTLILSIMLLLAAGVAEAKKVRVVAHRGYWNTEGSSRNSISALNNAMTIGAYGTEFDVNMTALIIQNNGHGLTVFHQIP